MARLSGSRAINHHLRRIFPGTVVLNGGVLCKPTPEHFLEGVVVEQSRGKGRFYIWSMMSPLWVPVRPPILDYSERLDRGYVFEGPEQSIAEHAAALIRKQDIFVQRLQAPEISLQAFLSDYAGTEPNGTAEWIKQKHRGIALALLGETEAACANFTAMVARYVRDFDHPYIRRMIAIQQSLVARDGKHLALITDMETEAAQQIGLTRPAIAQPSASQAGRVRQFR